MNFNKGPLARLTPGPLWLGHRLNGLRSASEAQSL